MYQRQTIFHDFFNEASLGIYTILFIFIRIVFFKCIKQKVNNTIISLEDNVILCPASDWEILNCIKLT
jgi:hypothetical protein